MNAITFAATALSIVLLGTGIWGYRASLFRRSNRAAHFLAWALLLLALKYVSRGAVWDVLLPALEWAGRDHLVTGMRANRASINAAFTVIVIAAAICIHLSLFWSIPAGDRNRWNLLTAWRHPSGGRPL